MENTCGLCREAPETINHLMIQCTYSRNMHGFQVEHVKQLLQLSIESFVKERRRKKWKGDIEEWFRNQAIPAFFWVLWNER